MPRTAEEIYQDALKLTPDEREILEVLLRLSLPLPDDPHAEPGRASSGNDKPYS
ncbi:MAG: hypothetical protein QGH93_04965 [Gammaproteobacteria bacterium]|jgi:hypothetical protein|nr:hypothetical protein [Gammaproteobacteria bacterium]